MGAGSQRARALAFAYRAWPGWVQSAIWRLALGIGIGLTAWLVIQVIRFAAEASGACTGCNVGDSPDVLGAATVGGSGAALGGEGNPPGKGRFDNWLDNLLGGGGPQPSVEAVEPSPPPDPEARQRAIDEQRSLFDFYKQMIGISGAEEGSVGDELSKAMDRVADFSSGETEIGPTPDTDDD